MDGPEPVVLGPEDGDISPAGRVRDRFMLEAHQTGGRFALLEHRFEPHSLAAPVHRHAHEDEYTFVLQGRIGAVLGGREVLAGAGDLVHKPRGQWHTFWNPGDDEARVLELISPGGFEQLFRSMMTQPVEDPDDLAAAGAAYGAEIDMAATVRLLEEHAGLFEL
jgi:quercetin dioxygenase-like cupin family protein